MENIKIETYKEVENLKIPVNNGNSLKIELIKANKKENNQYLKITRLDEHGNKGRAEYINEGDLVLLWNLYIYKKENNEEIF